MSEEQNTKKNFSVKQFFKSTAFKCIAVLVVIVLVCGVLLTICNALFRVTDEERLDRVLGSIYPDGQVDEIIYNESHSTELETEFTSTNGTIDAVYLMDDGNYLINSTGGGGWSSGTVSCWVVVEMDGTTAIEGIGRVAISGNVGQTFMNKITDEELEFFSDNYVDGENFVVDDYTADTVGTSATAPYTRTAITNAVNTALTFVRTQILDEEEPEPEPVNPFAEFEYIQYIDGQKTKVELAENGTDVVFNIVAVPYTFTGEFKLSVTVNAEGVITAMTVPATPAEGNGSTMGYEDRMDPDVLNGTLYIDKNAQQILALLGGTDKDSFTYEDLVTVPSDQASSDTITSGATYSNFIVTYSALFAASNYDKGYEIALENSIVYTDYIDLDKTTFETSGEDVIFHVVTANVEFTSASYVDITVSGEGVIVDYTITDDNATYGYDASIAPAILDGSMFENHTAAELIPLFGTAIGEDGSFNHQNTDNALQTGATYSNFYYAYAAVFAASNYETFPALMEYRQQQLNAQMSEIYGEEITVEAVDISSFTATAENGTVNAVYKVIGTDNYIVNATGNGGFMSGTVTSWVVIKTANSAVTQIGNMVIESHVNQSYMDRLDQNDFDYFKDLVVNGDITVDGWKADELHGGATVTYTMTAIVNSVNVAKNFVAANLLTGGTVA